MVLARAVTAATLWSGDDAGPERELLASWCRQQAVTAQAGGDSQLELVRAWSRVTDDVVSLEVWTAGDDLPPGLRLDTDLRWRLVQRLAVLGAVEADRLDAEYDRDRTSAAWLARWGARAGSASAEAKEKAWTAAVGGSLSNHELEAVGRAFWQPGQSGVLTPYRERYAADLPELARTASAATLDDFGRLMFPRTLVEPASVEMAERLLAEPDLPMPAHRIVAECRDDVLEGLRAISAG
jgi:aminopeptidase N